MCKRVDRTSGKVGRKKVQKVVAWEEIKQKFLDNKENFKQYEQRHPYPEHGALLYMLLRIEAGKGKG